MLVAWTFLFAAIAMEVAATLTMNESGKSGSIASFALMWLLISLSYSLLSFALRKIKVGVAIAIWEGLGTSLIALISMIFLFEPVSIQKILGIATAMCGIGLVHIGNLE